MRAAPGYSKAGKVRERVPWGALRVLRQTLKLQPAARRRRQRASKGPARQPTGANNTTQCFATGDATAGDAASCSRQRRGRRREGASRPRGLAGQGSQRARK